jgi:nucleoside phosphorylase
VGDMEPDEDILKPISDVIYFTKPEEYRLVDIAGLNFLGERLVGNFIINYYEDKNFKFAMTHGNRQGAEFAYTIVDFLSQFKPTNIILCGICASTSANLPIGETVVSTDSLLMSGKLKDLDINQLQMDNSLENNVFHLADIKTLEFKTEVKFLGYLQTPFVMEMDFNNIISKLRLLSRNIGVIDMESWYFLNSTRNVIGYSFPVVKTISDFGLNKNDEHHKQAIKNSFLTGLTILKRYNELGNTTSLKRSRTTLSIKMPLNKRIKRRIISYNKLKNMIENEEDLKFLKKALTKTNYKDMGVQNYHCFKEFLSEETQKLIEKELLLT